MQIGNYVVVGTKRLRLSLYLVCSRLCVSQSVYLEEFTVILILLFYVPHDGLSRPNDYIQMKVSQVNTIVLQIF